MIFVAPFSHLGIVQLQEYGKALLSTNLMCDLPQVQVQTNEDALSEEVQTEEVLTRNKWTQRPPHISVRPAQKGEAEEEEEGHHHLPGPEDYLGVGGDLDPDEMAKMTRKIDSSGHIAAFLSSASQVNILPWNGVQYHGCCWSDTVYEFSYIYI